MTANHPLRITVRGFLLLALCAFAFGSAAAQSATATLSGTVEDQNGAVVPGATVTAVNTATALERRTTTNGSGDYTIPLLPPGTYVIRVEAQGFAPVRTTDIVLNLGDHKVLQIQLKAGDISAAVTIESDAVTLNVSNGSVSTVVDQRNVANMPLNGRSFQDLILLTPGVLTTSPQIGASLGTSGEFSVNGQRAEANNYIVDGVSGNIGVTDAARMVGGTGASGSLPASTALGTTQALVSVDDLQEFRVQSSTYSAEYGRNPGGQFSFETKSGTNQFHGTAYEYLRNGALDAQDWFNNYFGLKQPTLRQNDFGGTFGGPVMLPRFGEGGRQPGYNGRNKSFFFFSYEGLRLAAPHAAEASFVPDATLRASSPAALRQVLNAFPAQSPNGIDDTVNGIAQFIGSWSTPASLNSTSIRFDHAITDKFRAFFRFSDTNSRSESLGTVRTNLTPGTDQISAYVIRTYTAGISNIFSNRFSNEFRFNFSLNRVRTTQITDSIGGNTPVNLLQLSGVGSEGQAGVLLVYGGYFTILQESNQRTEQKQWNFVDTASLSVGRHQLKVGLDYRRLAPMLIRPNPQAAYLYLSKAQVLANTSNANFQTVGPAYPLYTNFSAFAQDEWRASQRLSLSVGVRWEVNPAPGVTQGLRPYTIAFVSPDPNTWTLAPQGTPLWKTAWFNFAPRLGVAYVLRNSLAWETVIRGGVGVFFDTGQQKGSFGFAGPGFSALKSVSSASFPTPVPPISLVNPPVAPYGTVFGYPTHLQLPYTLQWNVSMEQALGKTQAITISYIGAHGSRLLQTNNLRPTKNPNVTTFTISENGLTSDYDAFQAQFRRRLSRGLTALASYTWSHCLDYGSLNFDFGWQRGNCDFDVRHNLSVASSYDLPNVGHSSFLKATLHHWGVDERFTARTAFPVTLNGRTLLGPNLEQFHAGLNLVPGQPVYLFGANCDSVLRGLGNLGAGMGCPGGRAINPQAFANVSSGLGTAPRNFLRGFGAWQMDLAVRRDFVIHEQVKLQFRAEAFNVFNHPNFGIINPNFGQKTFGQATASLASSLGALSPLYQLGGPRSIQFALKLSW